MRIFFSSFTSKRIRNSSSESFLQKNPTTEESRNQQIHLSRDIPVLIGWFSSTLFVFSFCLSFIKTTAIFESTFWNPIELFFFISFDFTIVVAKYLQLYGQVSGMLAWPLNIFIGEVATLASGRDIWQRINVGSGKFGKKNKHRALNNRLHARFFQQLAHQMVA